MSLSRERHGSIASSFRFSARFTRGQSMKRRFAVGLVLSSLVCACGGFVFAADAPDDTKPAVKKPDPKAGDKAAPSASAESEALLKDKGLVRVDPFFVLAGERAITQQM